MTVRLVSFIGQRFTRLTVALALLALGIQTFAQPAKNSVPRPGAKTEDKTNRNARELQSSLDGVRASQLSGKPENIADANQKLIGLALRDLGNVKASEAMWPDAADLYRQSLDFGEKAGEKAETHVDLAIAYLRTGRADEALAESGKAVALDPKSSRAWHVQGKAQMLKRNYTDAAQSLGHAISLRSDMEAAYSLGVCFLELKQKAKAAAIFRQMTEVAGDRGLFHGLFGRAYQKEELYDEARDEYRTALRLDPTIPHIHYFLGLVDTIMNTWVPTPEARRQFLLESGEYPADFFGNYFTGYIAFLDKRNDDASHYLRIAAAARPEWPESWMMLGLMAHDQGDNIEAEKLLRKAIELTGADEAKNRYQIRRAYYALGRILMETGRKEEGAKLLHHSGELQALGLKESQQAVSTQVLRSAHQSGMGASEMLQAPNGEPAMESGNGDDSMDDLDADQPALSPAQMTEAERQEQTLRAILGTAFNDLGTAEARQQLYPQALAHYREAERWDPNTPLLARNLGLAAAETHDYPEAVRALQKALEGQPSDTLVRCMLGLSLFTVGDFSGAVSVFDGAGDAVFSQPGLAYAYASSLSKTHKVQEGTKVLERLEQQPLPPEMLLLVGQVWSDMADYPRAVATFHEALRLNPSTPKAHYYAGLALMRSDKTQDAETEFRAELKLDPIDVEAQYDLAYALLQLQKNDEARDLLTRVVNAKPDHADAHYRLGKLLFEEGQIKSAIDHLEIAARVNPDLDYVHYQLQSAYRKDGRLADADAELKVYREVKSRNRQRTLPQTDREQNP